MPTVNTTSHTTIDQLIEQRLDAIDRALLGLLPRSDRLAAVAQVETRIREAILASSACAAILPTAMQDPSLADATLTSMSQESPTFLPQPQFIRIPINGWTSSTRKKLSRLALAASVVGILALVLLLAVPVTYITVEMLADVMGEVIAIGLLAAQGIAIAVGGAAAVGLGIGALVSLHRHREQLAGRGWAIAGLSTGFLPMLLGGVGLLILGMQFGIGQFFLSVENSPVQVASGDDSAKHEGSGSYENLPTSSSVPTMAGDYPECRPMPPQGAEPAYYPSAATPLQPLVESSRVVPAPLPTPVVLPQPDAAPRAAVPSPTEPQSAPRPAQPAGTSSSPIPPSTTDSTYEIE